MILILYDFSIMFELKNVTTKLAHSHNNYYKLYKISFTHDSLQKIHIT